MFLKIISFDLEVLPLRNQMPTPDKCPILLISNHFNFDYVVGDKKVRNIVLILTKEDSENGKIEFSGDGGNRLVFYLKDEKVMLEKLFDLMRRCDVITGYNINGFDIPYIFGSTSRMGDVPYVKGRWSVLGGKGVNIGNGDKRVFCDSSVSKNMRTVKVGNILGKIVFDVMYLLRREDESNIFKKEYNLKNVTLKHVSKEILNIEKLEFSPEEMIDYWNGVHGVVDKEIRRKFSDYCSRDSQLALMFVTKYRLLDRFIMMSRRSGKILQAAIDSLGSGILVENLLLPAYRAEDRVMACRKKVAPEKIKLLGAFVREPKIGLDEYLISLDYKSLYPSLMIKHNICYSTVIKDDMKIDESKVLEMKDEMGNVYGKFIKKEVYTGIVPKLLMGLLNERATLKKELKKYEKGTPEYILYDASQQAVKILLNSFYGYSGDNKARLYYWTVATAVTTNGRLQIMKTINMIENDINTIEFEGRKFKLEVAIADTDSSYVKLLNVNKGNGQLVRIEDAMYCVKKITEYVNSRLEKPMELAFENYINRIVIVAKKHYAMVVEDSSGKKSIISKGIESVRRDYCNYATENLSDIIDYVLMENDVKIGIDKSIQLIKDEARKLKKGEVKPEDLALSNKLTKAITAYDNLEPHVQVAIKQKERGFPYQEGDRVQYLIIDNGKTLVSERAEDYNYVIEKGLKIDYNYYLNNQFLPSAIKILELLGINKEVLMVGLDEGQKNLKEWFL